MQVIALQTGRRVFLRRLLLTDEQEFLEAVEDSRRLHHPHVSPPHTPQAFRRFVERQSTRSLRHVICRKDDGALVGVFDLQQVIRGPFESAFLGYYGFRAFAGQGYMREGLGLLLVQAFQRYKLHRLEAHIQPQNRASIALCESHGFRCEGISPRFLKVAGRWRDHLRYALDKDDWRTYRRIQGCAVRQERAAHRPAG
jgi:ribosomal-protein-alanine N-acetyltransferase